MPRDCARRLVAGDMVGRVRGVCAGLAVAGLACLPVLSFGTARAADGPIHDVVELFTSQGCSSCPPADDILTRLADEPGVLALAYHVDYWDYIGWRDRFGSPENTRRQRAYAQAMGSGTIYTPEVVVNGSEAAVGSREKKIRHLIERSHLRGGPGVRVGITAVGDKLHITAEGDPAAGNAGPPPALMLVVFDDREVTRIDRGENAGHTIVNTHAVRGWRVLGLWQGQPMSVDIPVAMLPKPAEGAYGCAAILQSVTRDGAPGPILAAAKVEFDGK